jgi:hypothetical protein
MCSMSSQTAKKNTEINKDIIDKLQAMADLYGTTNGMKDCPSNLFEEGFYVFV